MESEWTMERLRHEAAEREGASRFERLVPCLTGTRPSPRYGEVAVDLGVSESSVKNSVSRLRHKLVDDSRAPRFIKTVWRAGYQFIGKPEND